MYIAMLQLPSSKSPTIYTQKSLFCQQIKKIRLGELVKIEHAQISNTILTKIHYTVSQKFMPRMLPWILCEMK